MLLSVEVKRLCVFNLSCTILTRGLRKAALNLSYKKRWRHHHMIKTNFRFRRTLELSGKQSGVNFCEWHINLNWWRVKSVEAAKMPLGAGGFLPKKRYSTLNWKPFVGFRLVCPKPYFTRKSSVYTKIGLYVDVLYTPTVLHCMLSDRHCVEIINSFPTILILYYLLYFKNYYRLLQRAPCGQRAVPEVPQLWPLDLRVQQHPQVRPQGLQD